MPPLLTSQTNSACSLGCSAENKLGRKTKLAQALFGPQSLGYKVDLNDYGVVWEQGYYTCICHNESLISKVTQLILVSTEHQSYTVNHAWLNKQNLRQVTLELKNSPVQVHHIWCFHSVSLTWVETETSFTFVPILCILVQQVTTSTTKCDLSNIVYPLSRVQVNVTLMVGHQIFITVITSAHWWCKNCYWGEVVVLEGFKQGRAVGFNELCQKPSSVYR